MPDEKPKRAPDLVFEPDADPDEVFAAIQELGKQQDAGPDDDPAAKAKKVDRLKKFQPGKPK